MPTGHPLNPARTLGCMKGMGGLKKGPGRGKKGVKNFEVGEGSGAARSIGNKETQNNG